MSDALRVLLSLDLLYQLALLFVLLAAIFLAAGVQLHNGALKLAAWLLELFAVGFLFIEGLNGLTSGSPQMVDLVFFLTSLGCIAVWGYSIVSPERFTPRPRQHGPVQYRTVKRKRATASA